MPPVTHEIDDASLSKDSVFDWGSLPGHRNNDGVSALTSPAARGGGGATSSAGNNDRVSRYDPRAMNRITDITDLVDDSDESEAGGRPSLVVGSGDDGAGGDGGAAGGGGGRSGGRRYRWRRGEGGIGANNNSIACRQAIVLLSIVAIVASAALAIGYAVVNGQPKSSSSGGVSQVSPAPHAVVDPGPGDEDVALVQAAPEEAQEFLELAERVVTVCGETSLDRDMAQCQHVCRDSMCCFDSGQYSCEDDHTKNCVAYAGCLALVEGIPLGAGDEDEG